MSAGLPWWLARPEIEQMARRGDAIGDIQALITRELGMAIKDRTVSSRISHLGWREGTSRGRRKGHVYGTIQADFGASLATLDEPPAPIPDDKAFLRAKAKAEAERVRLRDAERETKLLRRVEAGRVAFLDDYDTLLTRRPALAITPPVLPRLGERPPSDLVLFLSDLHAGQLMAEASGLNHYNLAIFNERVNRLVVQVLEHASLLRAGGPVSRLVIVWGGDIVDGRDIHPGHDWQSIPLVEQLDGAGQILIHCLLGVFAAHFEQVICRVIPGNHGRIGKKGQLHIAGDNADMILAHQMMRLTEGTPNISWKISKSWFTTFKLHGHNFVAAHGDAFKAFSGIPFYGAQRYLQRLSAMFHVVPDVLLVGHHHNAASFPQGWAHIVMNGSMVGTGEFGAFLGYSGPPRQTLLVVNDRLPVAANFDLVLASRQEMVTAEFDDLDVA